MNISKTVHGFCLDSEVTRNLPPVDVWPWGEAMAGPQGNPEKKGFLHLPDYSVGGEQHLTVVQMV
jgi:hypothetical protein